MKKLLSIILTVAMLMSTVVVFNVANVSAESSTPSITHGEYTPIDISSKFNAIGYVSAEKAGTYSADDANMKFPHFFMNIPAVIPAGTTSPMAISSEAVSELAPKGTATLNGVPYYLSAPADDTNGVIKAQSQEISIPKGYYRAVKFLVVYNPTGGGNNDFYNNYYTTGGTDVGAKKASDQVVGTIKRAKVLTTDTEPSDVKLSEITFELNDKTKEMSSVKIWQLNETVIRVLAVTMEGLKGSEWNPIIATKIAALPDVSAYTEEANYNAFAEVDKLVNLAKDGGSDVSQIEGIEKYNQIKAKQQALSERFVPLDISSKFNSKIYLSEATAGTIESPAYPDFTITSNGGNPYAISKEGMDALLTDGIYTYKGVPYNIKTLDNQKSAIGPVFTEMYITPGYYSKIKVLTAISSNGSNGQDYIYVNDNANHTSNTITNLPKAKVTATDTNYTSGNISLQEWTYEVANKTTKSGYIKFWYPGDSPRRILAVTMEGLKGSEWNPIIATKIAALPDVSAYTEEANYNAFAEVDKLVNLAKDGGSDVSQIEGIEKYNQIKAKQQALSERFVPINISSHFNAIGYVSAEKAGTYSSDDANMKYPHFFKNSGGTATSPMAISSEAVSNLAPEGTATLNGVPYYLSAPADGQNGVIKAQSQVINIPKGYYRAVKLLVVYNPTGGGNNDFWNNYYTTSGTDVGAEKVNDTVVGTIKRAKVLTTDTEPSDVKLSEITFELNDKTKEMSSVKIWQLNETVIRVLAVTMEGLKGSEWNPIIAEKIAALPEPNSITMADFTAIEEIEDMLKSAENTGCDTAAIAGMDKFNKALERCEQIIASNNNCELVCVGGDITINVTFDISVSEADITKENIVVKCGGEAVDYAVSAVKENDVVTGAKVELKNKLTGADNYQLKVNINDTVKYERAWSVQKPVTITEQLMKNSSGKTVYSVSEITDGKLALTAKINNNTYEGSKQAKVVAAVYNGEKLEVVTVTDVTLVNGTAYEFNKVLDIPTTGLTSEWNAVLYVWDEDMITPLAAKGTKTYGSSVIADSSKNITFAFIGGSITEGGHVTTPLVENWQADRTGKITSINAGQGGTMSNYGTMRLYEEVLVHNPDIVFVDFTGNDAYLSEEQMKANVESMIKQMEALEHQPVVVFWYWPHRSSAGFDDRIAIYDEACAYYGVPTLNAHQLVVDAINAEGSTVTWDDFVPENDVHPTATQGKKIADLAYNLFKENNYQNFIKNIKSMPKIYGSDEYTMPQSISSSDADYATYDDNWEDSEVEGVVTEGYNVPTSIPFESFMASSTEGAQMTFKFRGTKLLISSLMGKNGRSASYVILNNNGEVEKEGTLTNYIDNSWYENVILSVNGLEDAEHTMIITVKAGEGLFGLGDFWIDE